MFPMDGALIIDKPAGMTSHDVVARVRQLMGERRVGHTGTLDPFATGVLVVLVGRATRLAQFLSGADKEYEAVIRLGYATDTGDVTGKRLECKEDFTAETQRAQSLRREDVEAAVASLRGEIEQIPPMYSAKKIAGRKLYELARRGEEVERKPVRVIISDFEIIAPDGALLTPERDGSHDLKARVVCSAGTYIRTLAEDFGQRLELGAHVAALRRTRAGRFTIADAFTLERLSELLESALIESALMSPDAAISHLPAVSLSADEVSRSLHGADMQIEDAQASDWPEGQAVRMRDADGDLVAVGIYDEGRKTLHPKVVITNE
ncbi:MAG TPA: tRNA pseudouridine(55) synthase TruB [Pyrinomonadaceae bacterium]